MARQVFQRWATAVKSRSAGQRQRRSRGTHLRVPPGLRRLVRERQGGTCGNCPAAIETFHHVLPSSEGGQNTEDNVLGLCQACHVAVHRFPVWAGRLGLLRGRTTIDDGSTKASGLCAACDDTGEVMAGAHATEHGVRIVSRPCLACLVWRED